MGTWTVKLSDGRVKTGVEADTQEAAAEKAAAMPVDSWVVNMHDGAKIRVPRGANVNSPEDAQAQAEAKYKPYDGVAPPPWTVPIGDLPTASVGPPGASSAADQRKTDSAAKAQAADAEGGGGLPWFEQEQYRAPITKTIAGAGASLMAPAAATGSRLLNLGANALSQGAAVGGSDWLSNLITHFSAANTPRQGIDRQPPLPANPALAFDRGQDAQPAPVAAPAPTAPPSLTQSLDVPGMNREALHAGEWAAGGTALMGALGAAADKMFRLDWTPEQQQVANWARDQYQQTGKKIMMPLTSAGKALPGATSPEALSTASNATVLGTLKTNSDAVAVTQYLNRNINGVNGGDLVPGASVMEDAAKNGQRFLRQAFQPGEQAVHSTFDDFVSTVGADTPIPISQATHDAIDTAVTTLKGKGAIRGPLYDQLVAMSEAKPESLTAQDVNDTYQELFSNMKRQRTAMTQGRQVLDALGQDINQVAVPKGMDVAGNINDAHTLSQQAKDLADIPSLKKLSREIGTRGAFSSPRQWMGEMFKDPDGEALAKLRDLNPDLYRQTSDSWLAYNLNRFSRPSANPIVGRTLDGGALYDWVKDNSDSLAKIYPAPQLEAITNFATYARYMGAAQEAAKPTSVGGMWARTLTQLGGPLAVGASHVVGPLAPAIVIGGEPAGYLLARGLSDPNSSLFRLFTEGFPKSARNFMGKMLPAAVAVNAAD